MAQKKYFWFKLSNDFFKDRRIKRLRRLAGGDTFTIIYMKMLLLTLPTKGMYEIDDYEDLSESVALDIDEDADNVKVTLEFLRSCGLVIDKSSNEYIFTDVENLVGSESDSAARVRRFREKKKKELQCNDSVTSAKQNSNDRVREEKDIELDKDKDKDIELEKSESTNNALGNTQTQSILLNTEINLGQYRFLCAKYGNEIVDKKIERSKKYKNCSDYTTISKWCDEEIEKELDDLFEPLSHQ